MKCGILNLEIGRQLECRAIQETQMRSQIRERFWRIQKVKGLRMATVIRMQKYRTMIYIN